MGEEELGARTTGAIQRPRQIFPEVSLNAAIKKMSRSEKLRAMEELWTDLTRDEGKYSSPAWHFEVLDKTEREIRAGRVRFINWEAAKSAIRRRAK
jgi:Putative addiction module component